MDPEEIGWGATELPLTKPVVYANDDPRILDLAASPELEAVCI